MVNSYPVWKYILVFFVLIIGVIYAIPNVYREDPSVCIIGDIYKHEKLDDNVLFDIKKVLKDSNILVKSILLESNKIIIRCFCNYDQVHIYEKLSSVLLNKYIISCSTLSTMPHWLFIIHAKPVRLGLDLRGGIHLSMYVNVNSILNRLQEQYVDTVRCIFHDKIIPYLKILKIENYGIEISLKNSEDRKKTILLLSEDNHNIVIHSIGIKNLKIFFSENYLFKVREYAVKQNIAILRHRLCQLGIFEPLIQRYGTDRIVIELPGIQDIEKIKKTVSATSNLEFRLVNTTIKQFEIDFNVISEDSELKLSDSGYLVPLYKKVILTGDCIVHSNVSFDEYNYPQVNLTLNKVGSIVMSEFTKNNIGKKIATVFIEYENSGQKDCDGHDILIKNERVINIATIQSQVSNNFSIVGINNINRAYHLSALLKEGALAAPIHIEEERIIGSIFGKTNINKGLTACIVGIIISVFFMVLWYHFFGLIASTALIVNLVLMISIISLIPGMVLTMPSIAGIVLTLAVAVDANVLINERIKEEIFQGKPMQYAIHVGYRKAFISIMDANITTIITAIILYFLGTGMIKGFAMTTVIGVITSMFTSIVGTRAFVNLVYGKKHVDKLSI